MTDRLGPGNTKNARDALTRLVVDNPDLERLETLAGQFNIFEAVGVVRQELRHSDFLAFLLDPAQPHGLGDAFAKRLLQRALLAAPDRAVDVTPLDLDAWRLDRLAVRREWYRIDILLEDPDNRVVVPIENKVGSGEHSGQLGRYLDEVRAQFPGWRLLPIYLSPDGAEPSHDAYLPLGYGTVCDVAEHLAAARHASLDPHVHALVVHYARLLRRHVVEDSEVAELCRRIYRQHRKAIDLIVEHRPDRQTDVRDFLVGLIGDTGGMIPDQSNRNYIRFAVPEWDLPELRGSGWTTSGRMLLFEFRNKPNGALDLVLLVGPGDEALRDTLIAGAERAGPPLRVRGKRGQKWMTVFHRQVLPAGDAEDLEPEQREGRIREFWGRFLREDLPELKAAYDARGIAAQWRGAIEDCDSTDWEPPGDGGLAG